MKSVSQHYAIGHGIRHDQIQGKLGILES